MIEIKQKRTGKVLLSLPADSLRGIGLEDARLFRAELSGAELSGAVLQGADLRQASLAGAALSDACLCGADLSGANLSGADLRNADLRAVRAEKTLFREARLVGAQLDGADLRRADLSGANLTGAFLRETLLPNAVLSNADLRDAVLEVADLRGARLSGAMLAGINLDGAVYDARTEWPADFQPEEAGAWREKKQLTDGNIYSVEPGDGPRSIITWGVHPGSFLSDREDASLRFCPPICDPLDWGPQHVDLATQTLLRQCFFQSTHPLLDLRALDAYAEALGRGDQALFWCWRSLPGCLGIMWALEALVARGVALGNAQLLLYPGAWGQGPTQPALVRRSFHQLVPVSEVFEGLIAVRRELASDSEEVRADVTALPESVRAWASATDLLEDYLPDERGLDLMDSILLDLLTRKWRGTPHVVVEAISRTPSGHRWGDVQLWERLMELGEHPPFRPGSGTGALVEVQLAPGAQWAQTNFRITRLGERVRAGELDALEHRPFFRWVGGRLITNERPIRRGKAHEVSTCDTIDG